MKNGSASVDAVPRTNSVPDWGKADSEPPGASSARARARATSKRRVVGLMEVCPRYEEKNKHKVVFLPLGPQGEEAKTRERMHAVLLLAQ